METPIFHQRLCYASISLVKNYSSLPKKRETTSPFDIFGPNSTEMIEISGGYKKPSAHFFYNKNEGITLQRKLNNLSNEGHQINNVIISE